MDSKIKMVVLLALLGGGGYFGYRYLQEDAKGAKDEELLTKYVLGKAGGVSPFNVEAQRRVEVEEMKLPFLTEHAVKGKEDKERQVAFRLMGHVQKRYRDDVLRFIEDQWRRQQNTEVREQMIHAVKENALNGMDDQGKAAIKFLSHTAPADASKETIVNLVDAMKEVLDGTLFHDATGLTNWYSSGGSSFRIPLERSNTRGKNK